jgi:ribosomal protein L21E
VEKELIQTNHTTWAFQPSLKEIFRKKNKNHLSHVTPKIQAGAVVKISIDGFLHSFLQGGLL